MFAPFYAGKNAPGKNKFRKATLKRSVAKAPSVVPEPKPSLKAVSSKQASLKMPTLKAVSSKKDSLKVPTLKADSPKKAVSVKKASNKKKSVSMKAKKTKKTPCGNAGRRLIKCRLNKSSSGRTCKKAGKNLIACRWAK